jgi:type IV secretory pathway TrbD component
MSTNIPIHEALVSPPQVMGCERRWVVLSASISALLAGPAGLFTGNLIMVVVGLFVFGVSVALGRHWTEKDPQFREVHVEAFAYEQTYAATSHWHVKESRVRSWT